MYCHNCGAHNADAALRCEQCDEPFVNDAGANPFTVGAATPLNDVYYQPSTRRNFASATRTCLLKWTPKGRASLSEFWYWALFLFCSTFMPLALCDAATGGFSDFKIVPWSDSLDDEFVFTSFIWSAICVVPTFCVTIRRLHDAGKSPWNLLLIAVPLAVLIIGDSLEEEIYALRTNIRTVVAVAGFILGFVSPVWLLICLCRPSKKDKVGDKSLKKRASKRSKKPNVATPNAFSSQNEYCRHCGALNQADAFFCVHCGASTTEESEEVALFVVDVERKESSSRSFWGSIWACWNNWSFLGRSSRSDFWRWGLFQGGVVLCYVVANTLSHGDAGLFFVLIRRLVHIVWILSLIPTYAVASRRFHDVGWIATPWLLLFTGLPIVAVSLSFHVSGYVGLAVLLVWIVVCSMIVVLLARAGKVDEPEDVGALEQEFDR